MFQVGYSLDFTIDSGYIIGGHGGNTPQLTRGVIVKLNSAGQVDWYKMLTENPDGTGNIWKSRVNRIMQLADSSFVCVRLICRPEAFQPFKMIIDQIDFNGNELWRRSFNSGKWTMIRTDMVCI